MYGRLGDVLGVVLGIVVKGVGPLGVAVASLIESQAVEFPPQGQASQVPGPRGLSPAVEEEHR